MSSIPFSNGKTIGEDIPTCEHAVVYAPFTAAEKVAYDKRTPRLYRKLVRKLKTTGKIIWDMNKYRQLALLITLLMS